MFRGNTPVALAAGSLFALSVLAAGLYWRAQPNRKESVSHPLIVFAAAAVRPPLEAAAREYERETGQVVELQFGASEHMLMRAAMPHPIEPADIFLPADESYIQLARERGMVAATYPIARMRVVLLLAPHNPKAITAWADLTRPGMVVAVPNHAAAAGKLTRDHLMATGRWEALQPHVVDTGTVTEAANAAQIGSAHAALVWDAVAAQPAYVGQTILTLPELEGVTAHVRLAVLTQSRSQDSAVRFARFLTDPLYGLREFQNRGFDAIGTGESQ